MDKELEDKLRSAFMAGYDEGYRCFDPDMLVLLADERERREKQWEFFKTHFEEKIRP